MSLTNEFIGLIDERLNPLREEIFEMKNIVNNLKPIPGPKGEPGIKGGPGKNGKDGKDGKDGRDGLSGKDGQDGKNGIDGKDFPQNEREKINDFMNRRGRLVGGVPVIKFIENEIPTGAINGSNRAYVLTKTPVTDSLKVFLNGARQRINDDYTLSLSTITFTNAPSTSSAILCDYRYF